MIRWRTSCRRARTHRNETRSQLDPLSLIINSNLGFAYIHSGRLDEAVAQLRKTVEMDGGFYYARYALGLALELKGAIPEAIAEYQKAIGNTEDPVPLGMLGRLYAAQGRKDEAQKILQQLRRRRGTLYCGLLTGFGLSRHG